MKKAVIFMAAVIGAAVLSSCAAKTSGNQTTVVQTTSVVGGTTAATDVWSTGVYVGDVVSDERTAQKIADVLFAEIIKKTRSEFTYTSIYYEEEQGAWVVDYALDKNTVGGDYAIVISKNTGEVLRIEYGE